jgi:hypothetical protein
VADKENRMRPLRTTRFRRLVTVAGILAAGWIAAGAPIHLGM